MNQLYVYINALPLRTFSHPFSNPISLGHYRAQCSAEHWAELPVIHSSCPLATYFTHGSTFHFHALEKEMATHSSVLAWRIPGTGEPGGLPSKESQSWTRLNQLSSSSSSSSSSVYMSVPISQVYPSPPQVHTSVLYVCLYSCPVNRFICTIFPDSTCINIQYIFLSF